MDYAESSPTALRAIPFAAHYVLPHPIPKLIRLTARTLVINLHALMQLPLPAQIGIWDYATTEYTVISNPDTGITPQVVMRLLTADDHPAYLPESCGSRMQRYLRKEPTLPIYIARTSLRGDLVWDSFSESR